MDLKNTRNQFLLTKLYQQFGEKMYNFHPASTFCFMEILERSPNDEMELKTFIAKGKNITDPLKDMLKSGKIETDFITPQKLCQLCGRKL